MSAIDDEARASHRLDGETHVVQAKFSATDLVIEIEVLKAQGPAVPSLRLSACETFPDNRPIGEVDLEANMDLHIACAAAIVNGLYASLPGGTLDQVLRLMLERKASQLVVRF